MRDGCDSGFSLRLLPFYSRNTRASPSKMSEGFEALQSAAQEVICNGNRRASAFLLRALSDAFSITSPPHRVNPENVFFQTMDALLTSPWYPTHVTIVHLLTAILSGYFRRTFLERLRSVPDKQQVLVVHAVCESLVPRLVLWMGWIASASGCPPNLAHRLLQSIACPISVLLLVGCRGEELVQAIENAVSSCVFQGICFAEVCIATLSCVLDSKVTLGPITRSFHRRSLQRSAHEVLQRLSASERCVETEVQLLQMLVELLNTYSVSDIQTQCPEFVELLAVHPLWTAALLPSIACDACPLHKKCLDAVCEVLASVHLVDGGAVSNMIHSCITATARCPPALCAVIGAVLEGTVEDIVLHPDACQLRVLLEDALGFLAGELERNGTCEWRVQMTKNVLLLLGTLRFHPIPALEDGDDEDDFKESIAELEAANANKLACLQRLSGFMRWVWKYLLGCLGHLTTTDFRAVFDAWVACDPETWAYDVEFADNVPLAVVVGLQRMCRLWSHDASVFDVASTSCVVRAALGDIEVLQSVPWTDASRYAESAVCLLCLLDNCSASAAERSRWCETALLSCCNASSALFVMIMQLVAKHDSIVLSSPAVADAVACADSSLAADRILTSILTLQRQGQWHAGHDFEKIWTSEAFSATTRLTAIAASAGSASLPPWAALMAAELLLAASRRASLECVRVEVGVVLSAAFRRLDAADSDALHRIAMLLCQAIQASPERDAEVLTSIISGLCTSQLVRGEALHGVISAAVAATAEALTGQQPIPYAELCFFVNAPAIFERSHGAWLLALVSWLLEQEQAQSLFESAAARLVRTACTACSHIIGCQTVLKEAATECFDRIVTYAMTALSCHEDSDEVTDALRELGALAALFANIGIASRCSAETMHLVAHAGDEFQAAHCLKSRLITGMRM